jgi:hypothetical protein
MISPVSGSTLAGTSTVDSVSWPTRRENALDLLGQPADERVFFVGQGAIHRKLRLRVRDAIVIGRLLQRELGDDGVGLLALGEQPHDVAAEILE